MTTLHTTPSPKHDALKAPAQPVTRKSFNNGHGDILVELIEHPIALKQHAPEKKATGIKAVISSFEYAVGEAGPLRGTLPLLQLNQKDGFDCPGCAWPDPDGHRSMFDFCENGAKAVAHESDKRRLTPEFFAKHTVSELSGQSDFWLEQQGRLTEPMVLRENATHYERISWEDAFTLIAAELNGLDSPNEASFYTSGKATNEAAFVYQLFARQLGTNNLPDCSNMCHESSGAALSQMFGLGKGTALLDDFQHAELIFVVGQNPGTNHPRQLTALQQAKRAGAKIITVNPLPETGLVSFMNPQEPLGMLGFATKLTDLFLQVKVNGDIPLFKGIIKALVEYDDKNPGKAINWEFVRANTADVDSLLEDIRAASWDDITHYSGINKEEIEQAAEWARNAERIILCWCLGVTQHQNGVQNVREMMNFMLLRGAIGKQGAGPCCVRGHSNVQGDRTMGVWERPHPEFLNRLADAFHFDPPREHGFDSQRTVRAMHAGLVKVFVSLGGNFLMAVPDTRYAAEAIQKTNLTVRIGTKLNRADLLTGRQSLILPCLGRTESDLRPSRTPGGKPIEQFTSTENSMGVVQRSTGRFSPASPHLLSEVQILCRMAYATLGDKSSIDWLAWDQDYDLVRDAVAQVIPGFENYNADVRNPGGFYLPNGPRQTRFTTPNGKANFTVNPISKVDLGPGQFAMTTVRSHDQFNTTIYGLHDRYRGLHYERRVVMMNPEDIRAQGLKNLQKVDVTSHHNGQTRTAESFVVVEYPVTKGCVAMYYPEANVLVPIDSTDTTSNCPSFKNTTISLTPRPNQETKSI